MAGLLAVAAAAYAYRAGVFSFLGSYDLQWEVVGYINGSPVVEFHVTNASTISSAMPSRSKVDNYTHNSAGAGGDAVPGEHWTKQSMRWRETFPGGQAPQGPLSNWSPAWPTYLPNPYQPIAFLAFYIGDPDLRNIFAYRKCDPTCPYPVPTAS